MTCPVHHPSPCAHARCPWTFIMKAWLKLVPTRFYLSNSSQCRFTFIFCLGISCWVFLVHMKVDVFYVNTHMFGLWPNVHRRRKGDDSRAQCWDAWFPCVRMTCFWHSAHPLSLAVTPEAIGFLSAVGVFVVLLTILFLFINKKLCFARVGGLPCFELRGHRKRKERSGIHQGLGEYAVTKHRRSRV